MKRLRSALGSPISAHKVALLGLVLAALLLALASLDWFGPWKPSLVGSAGEWFAGAAGFGVLLWATNEPHRQAARDKERELEARNLKAIEASVRAISRSRLRPGEKLPNDESVAMKARHLHDFLEIERRLFTDEELKLRVHVATDFLRRWYQHLEAEKGVKSRAHLEAGLRLLVPRVLESTNESLFAAWDSKRLDPCDWGWSDPSNPDAAPPPWPRDPRDVDGYITDFTYPPPDNPDGG